MCAFQITSIAKEQVQATLSQYQKFRKALIVAQEVCSLASEVGMSEFTKRLNLLSQLRDAWAEGKNVTISPADTGLLLHRNTIAL